MKITVSVEVNDYDDATFLVALAAALAAPHEYRDLAVPYYTSLKALPSALHHIGDLLSSYPDYFIEAFELDPKGKEFVTNFVRINDPSFDWD
jgi:hypothetical protein